METKKKWETPQLIVLGKGTPEENVLKHCKHVAQVMVLEVHCVVGVGPRVAGPARGWGSLKDRDDR